MGFAYQKILVKSGVIALITFFYLLPNALADGRKISDESHYYNNNNLEMAKHKGTIKTIEVWEPMNSFSENGELIDCVDIYKQPAFDHPLLKNHTIEMWPSSIKKEVTNDQNHVLFQAWHENGEYCPEGTIPIVRTPKSNYPQKVPLVSGMTTNDPVPNGHEYAQVSLRGGTYYGSNATFNVWSPSTSDNEFSLAQTWVLAGLDEEINSIEAGWIVNLKGDKRTRFFTFWTSDNYKNGCYDLECPGFVQVSSKVALGAGIQPLSTYNGQQYDITITIFKNKQSGHWWLTSRHEAIGYWPDVLFTKLVDSSEGINWGGEIINGLSGGHHTTTQMGSGHFPGEGFERASFVRNIQYMDGDGIFRDPERLTPYASKPSCYDVEIKHWGPEFGTYFYYGGPGFSSTCQL